MIYGFFLNLMTMLLRIISGLMENMALPDKWITGFQTALVFIYGIDLLFPISVFIECALWYLGFEVAIFTLRQAFNLINWVRGTGKGLDI